MNHRENKDLDYASALFLASINNHIEIILYLVNTFHIDLNSKGQSNETALILASANGHLEIVEYLLSQKVNIEVRQTNGENALLKAIKGGYTTIVEILLKKGANPNVSDQVSVGSGSEVYGTALVHASLNGHFDIVKLLLTYRAEIDGRNDQGNTALLLAINSNHFEIAEYLIQQGANPNIRNNLGFSPLMMAASKGNLKLVEMLVNKEAYINTVQKDKVFTALDLAWSGYYISKELKDREGIQKFRDVVEYLKSKGAKTGRELMKK